MASTEEEDARLAASLAAEEDADVAHDAELAAALAMEMAEEAAMIEAAERDQEDEAEQTAPVITVPPPSPPQPSENAVLGGVRSMLNRLVATITGDDPHQDEILDRQRRIDAARSRHFLLQTRVLNALEVQIPEDCRISGEIYVSAPDGSLARYELDPALAPGDWVLALYEGHDLVTGAGTLSGTDQVVDAAAALDFYRFHPAEVECESVPVNLGARCLGGAELVQRREGVFVQWAMCGQDTGLRGGDLVVSVADEAVESLAALQRFLQVIKLGSRLPVRVLRRPGIVVRCPNGHATRPREAASDFPPVCLRCEQAWACVGCAECAFALCSDCAWAQHRLSTMRFPVPMNAPDDGVQLLPFGARLSFSERDVGQRLVVFWFATGQWWLGEVLDYEDDKGHTVEYAETGGRKSREIVANFQVREYRLVADEGRYDTDASFVKVDTPVAASAGAAAAAAAAAGAEEEAHDLMGFDADDVGVLYAARSEGEEKASTPPAAAAASSSSDSPLLVASPAAAVPEVIALSKDEEELLKSLSA